MSLVAGQLLAADQAEAALAAEEQLKKSWGEGSQPEKGGVVVQACLFPSVDDLRRFGSDPGNVLGLLAGARPAFARGHIEPVMQAAACG